MKRFFPEDPSCPAVVEDLTRQSAMRRRKKGLVDDGLLTTTTQDLSRHRLILDPDLISKFDLSTPYDDLPPQYRKIYDSIRPSFPAPSTCQGVNYYSGRSCKKTPVPGSKFCARCDGVEKWDGSAKTKWCDDQHRLIMDKLGQHLKRLWEGLNSRGRTCHTPE